MGEEGNGDDRLAGVDVPVPGADRRIPPRTVLRFLARVLRVLIAPFVKLEVHGGRCATELDHGLIVANHRSLGDAIVGLIVLHRFGHYPRVLIAREYVDKGFVGYLARAVGTVPVDRDRDPARSLDPAIVALEAGVSILVMPEGKLHVDPADRNTVGPAKTGVARLTRQSGEPVVVAALAGTEDVWPADRRLPRVNPFRRRRIVCVVADDALRPESADPRVAADEIMAEVSRHLVMANRYLESDRDRSRREGDSAP
jgi:1-acyl-sn-glycerol-3-phosphate acyltransferase